MQRYALYYDSKEDMQHISANSKGGWVRYDDAQAEIARLTPKPVESAPGELAVEELLDAVQIGDEVYVTVHQYVDALERLVKVSAERDQALARAASAAMEMRERAAKKCKWHSDKLVETIRALPIDPDAQKALDEMLAKAREDAIRLSASIAKAWKTFDGEDHRSVEAVILDLLKDGGRDE